MTWPKRRVWRRLNNIIKNTPRAQMTPDVLFGPFFLFVGLRWPSWLLWALSGPMRGVAGVVQPADVVTNLRNGPNDASGVVWAFFPLHGPALAFLAAVGLRGLLWAWSGPM